MSCMRLNVAASLSTLRVSTDVKSTVNHNQISHIEQEQPNNKGTTSLLMSGPQSRSPASAKDSRFTCSELTCSELTCSEPSPLTPPTYYICTHVLGPGTSSTHLLCVVIMSYLVIVLSCVASYPSYLCCIRGTG